MRAFAEDWTDEQIVQQLAAQIPLEAELATVEMIETESNDLSD